MSGGYRMERENERMSKVLSTNLLNFEFRIRWETSALSRFEGALPLRPEPYPGPHHYRECDDLRREEELFKHLRRDDDANHFVDIT